MLEPLPRAPNTGPEDSRDGCEQARTNRQSEVGFGAQQAERPKGSRDPVSSESGFGSMPAQHSSDGNIRSNADLIAKSRFYTDPNFPDRKQARERDEATTVLDTSV